MQVLMRCLIGLVVSVCASAEPLLEGRVRLASGEPVADAQVRIFDMTDLRQGAIARALTDGTGYFALPLAALAGRALPARFALGPNYPNPFNPSTIIPYQLAASSAVRLEVFNLLGQHLATLVDGERAAGFHTAMWHAVDGAGRAVGAGVYIYRMTVGVESQTGRMVLIDGQAGVSAAGAASVWSGVSGGGEGAQVYGLIVSGSGLVPYVDSSFRVESGMAPVELVVSSGQHSAGKATDDDCAFCDLFGSFNDQQEEEEEETEEEEAETDSTSSEGGPDLIVQSPSVSDSMLTPGQEFTLNVTVRNQGDEQAAATMLHYYRSNNATITSSDTEVGTDEIGVLDASATSAKSITLTAPTSVSPQVGIYYGACVASVSGESNSDNNCSSAVRISEEEGNDIPDANLRAAVEAALGKARGAPITVADMKTLILLEAPKMGIRDLTGLEFATNLRQLFLSDNRITDLSPLGGLTNLEWLFISRNKITDLSPLGGLTNLTRLGLYDTGITDVSPLGGLTNLTELSIGGDNRITNVSALKGSTRLKKLYLSDSNLTDIDILPLGGLTNLTTLWLGENRITDVSPLKSLTNLTTLLLDDNKITDVSPLGGLTSLRQLSLARNEVTDVSPLGGLTNLERLWLDENRITSVSALGGLTNLRVLGLGGNRITNVSALPNLAYLEWLALWGNPLNVSSINDYIPVLKGRGATVHFDSSFRQGDFDIELVFLTPNHESLKQLVQYAARQYMSIITEDLPDYEFTQGRSSTCGGQSYEIPAGERIDDLRIYVVNDDLSPAWWGGPHVVRTTSNLPVLGCMSITGVVDIVLHEIGHVLGIGTIWDDFIQNPSGDTHFIGPRAIAAFNDAGGQNYTGAKVPVETDGSHWRDPVLEGEIMNPAGGEVLSAITIQALADLGYGVDVTQAAPYTLPSAAAKARAKIAAPSTHAQPELSCGVGQAREPIYVVDELGNTVRTIGD